MKFTQIPVDTFEKLQLNAGILCTGFTPESGNVEGLLGATSGGVAFDATQTFIDYGDGIDNCPKNTKELKDVDEWEAKISGSFVTIDANLAKRMLAAADVSGDKITPRNYLKDEDFSDIWWIGDYSDKNNGDNAGFIAIHMMNALSTGGFKIRSADKGKGAFAFEFTAHYSLEAQETVPFEMYVKAGA